MTESARRRDLVAAGASAGEVEALPSSGGPHVPVAVPPDDEFEALLVPLRDERGADVTGYPWPSPTRRTERLTSFPPGARSPSAPATGGRPCSS